MEVINHKNITNLEIFENNEINYFNTWLNIIEYNKGVVNKGKKIDELNHLYNLSKLFNPIEFNGVFDGLEYKIYDYIENKRIDEWGELVFENNDESYLYDLFFDFIKTFRQINVSKNPYIDMSFHSYNNVSNIIFKTFKEMIEIYLAFVKNLERI